MTDSESPSLSLGNYSIEVKLDNAGRFNRQPRAQVENAWMNFPVIPALAVRIGLYDMVFSRNALTSDSKLLLMDRSLIKGALTVLGITDNTVGILFHGRPFGGHLSYGFGVFDNLGFEVAESEGTLAREADGAMLTGRVVLDLLDPAPAGGYADYKSSYIGQGSRLSIGANTAFLQNAKVGDKRFDLYAMGADLFFNTGPLTFEAEVDNYEEMVENNGGPEVDGYGWYAQCGFLLFPFFELAARYQMLDQDDNDDTDRIEWTSLGFNIYVRGHNLKLQAEYTIKEEQALSVSNNIIQVQLQFDY